MHDAIERAARAGAAQLLRVGGRRLDIGKIELVDAGGNLVTAGARLILGDLRCLRAFGGAREIGQHQSHALTRQLNRHRAPNPMRGTSHERGSMRSDCEV